MSSGMELPSRGVIFGRWTPPFYYGWIIVAVVFLAEFVSTGMGQITVPLFFKPMSNELGWSLTELTGAITAQSLAGMFISPLVGPLLDRFGARPVMAFGALSAGLGLVLLMNVTQVWHFWLAYAVVGALGLHELGQLTGPVVVAKWFVRQRGRTIALATWGTVFGGAVMALVVGQLIGAVGWRSTWGIMGLSVIFVMLPIVLIFVRRQPEDLGLLPDGDPPSTLNSTDNLPDGNAEELQWTLSEAFRTKALWLIVAGLNLVSLSAGAVNLHMVPFFTQQIGLSTKGASYILTARLMGATLSRLPWGFVAERIPVRLALAAVFLGRSLGPLILITIPYPYCLAPFVFFSGFIGGTIGLMQPLIFANYYGRAFLGTIQGALRPLLMFSQLVGPLLVAAMFDYLGTFDLAFLISGIMGLVAIVVVCFATPPRRINKERV